MKRDENYLCLSMNGYNYAAGGAHGYYWSNYYVFDRHTGQRLFLEDFVDNNPEDIRQIVKNHIVAAAPYSKGEQSENALEQNRFFLTAEGLGIHYDVYEIGDYASGSFDFVIPFELFDMKEDIFMPSKQEKPESGQLKHQVYIQPDMPEPFIPASNESSAVLARAFDECREGQYPAPWGVSNFMPRCLRRGY